MEAQKLINLIAAIVFIVCYSFQFVYIPIVFMSKNKSDERKLTQGAEKNTTAGISEYRISDENNK